MTATFRRPSPTVGSSAYRREVGRRTDRARDWMLRHRRELMAAVA